LNFTFFFAVRISLHNFVFFSNVLVEFQSSFWMIAMVLIMQLFQGSYGQVCAVSFVNSEIECFFIFLGGVFGYLVGCLVFDIKCFLVVGISWKFLLFFLFSFFFSGWFCFVFGIVNFGLELKQNWSFVPFLFFLWKQDSLCCPF